MRKNTMATWSSNRSKIVLAISFMFVLSVMSPAALAGKGDGGSSPKVVVLDSAISGNAVLVKVQNLSNESLTVFVEVDAVVDGVKVHGMTPVSVFAGSTAGTVVGFTGSVSDVESAGISETGSPI
jgi:hypothetical protein